MQCQGERPGVAVRLFDDEKLVQWTRSICRIDAGWFSHMQDGGMRRSGGYADWRQRSIWKIRQVNVAVTSCSLHQIAREPVGPGWEDPVRIDRNLFTWNYRWIVSVCSKVIFGTCWEACIFFISFSRNISPNKGMEVFHYEETHCIRTFHGIVPGTYRRKRSHCICRWH